MLRHQNGDGWSTSGMSKKSKDKGTTSFSQLRYADDEQEASKDNVSNVLKREIIF